MSDFQVFLVMFLSFAFRRLKLISCWWTILFPEYFILGRTIIYSLSPFRENNNVVVFSIPFYIFMLLANLWLIRLQGHVPILRTCLDLYLLICPPKRRLSLGRGESLYWDLFGPILHQPSMTLPTLSCQEVQVGVFLSLRMRPEGVSHTSLVILKSLFLYDLFLFFVQRHLHLFISVIHIHPYFYFIEISQ